MRLLPQLPRQSCPAGATFSEPRLRKSVATFRRKNPRRIFDRAKRHPRADSSRFASAD
jgi:hypothetical protein